VSVRLLVVDCRLKIKSDRSQSKIINCHNPSTRIRIELVFLRRREAMTVQKGGRQ